MKKIAYIVLSCVFLASCSNLSSPRATASVKATFTLTPTFSPAKTPTVASTATETTDPNMPIGATGKDTQGNWVDETGNVWNPEVNAFERHLNLNDEEIPLFVLTALGHAAGMKDLVPLIVNVSVKLPGFEKLDSISLHPGVGEYV